MLKYNTWTSARWSCVWRCKGLNDGCRLIFSGDPIQSIKQYFIKFEMNLKFILIWLCAAHLSPKSLLFGRSKSPTHSGKRKESTNAKPRPSSRLLYSAAPSLPPIGTLEDGKTEETRRNIGIEEMKTKERRKNN